VLVLYERFIEQEQRHDYRSAQIARMLASGPCTIDDFLLFSRPVAQRHPTGTPSDQDTALATAMLEQFRAAEILSQTQGKHVFTIQETVDEPSAPPGAMPWETLIHDREVA